MPVKDAIFPILLNSCEMCRRVVLHDSRTTNSMIFAPLDTTLLLGQNLFVGVAVSRQDHRYDVHCLLHWSNTLRQQYQLCHPSVFQRYIPQKKRL